MKQAAKLYWWPGMAKDIKRFIKSCDACQRNKSSNQLPAGLLQPLPIPGRRWETVTTDFITDLPTTAAGFDSIVVFVDKLTKMVHLAPCNKTVTAQDFARLFFDTVCKHHGLPRQIVSDRGSVFVSNFWEELTKLFGTQRLLSSAYHPQTDGQTERYNRVLEETLRHFVNPAHDDWDVHLTSAEFAINNAWHESIQNTPFMLNCGQHPLTPATVDLDSRVPAAQEFMQGIQDNLAKAKKCLELAQQRDKQYANAHRRHVTFKPGDRVLVNTTNFNFQRANRSKKLLPRYMGPFAVVKTVGQVAYKLDLPANMKIHDVFHVSLLKPYSWNGKTVPPPPVIYEDGVPEYEVQRVLDHRDHRRGRTKRREFLVHWQGYGPEHSSWEPESNLTNCQEAVQQYWDSQSAVRSGHRAATAQPQVS
jgi:Chromo (CHRromatin Organisation MOdifier) domain/Integrase zinc binding domain